MLPYPPLFLMGQGSGSTDLRSYDEIGCEFLSYFRRFGALESGHRVLEIGSGSGRMARAIAGCLGTQGHYDGLDVLEEQILWCRENITPVFPNFRFHFLNVQNGAYNADGIIDPKDLRLPFDDQSFDFVYLTSVFTHMLPPGLRTYLYEVSRVLRVGKRCLITYFLLNEDQASLVRNSDNQPIFTFPHREPGCPYATEDASNPENAIAYDEGFLRHLYREAGLSIFGPVLYGAWSGRKNYVSGQDMIVAIKDAART